MHAHILNVIIKAQHIADYTSEDFLTTVDSHQSATTTTTSNTNSEKEATLSHHPVKTTKQHWKKPKDMPRRPLSAYNLFFKNERQIMVSSATTTHRPASTVVKNKHGKPKSLGIGFGGMARTIAGKWKTITTSERAIFEGQARIEKARYHKEMVVWRLKEADKKRALKDAAQAQNRHEQEDAATKQERIVPADTAKFLGYWEEYAERQTPFDDSDVTDKSLLHMLMQDMQETISNEEELQEGEIQSSSTNFCLPSAAIYEPVPIPCLKALMAVPSPVSSSSCRKIPEQEQDDFLIDDLSLFMFIMEAGGC